VVKVSGRCRDGSIEIRVSDNGPGIKPEDQGKIFTPFYTTKGPGRGMGLGLTIVWRVINSLEGTITVQSQPGAGTEFVVMLPRLKTPQQWVQPPPKVPVARS
jgi:signal transduction histidine kinase